MKIKADYLSRLHAHRERQYRIMFGRCPQKVFSVGLELGAGDGFQSHLLARHVGKLVASDLNPAILEQQGDQTIEYRVCDAEAVGSVFNEGEFDLVFSSNLLEHLPDLGKALRGIHHVLRDDGITIHILPNLWWKLSQILLYLPNRLVRFVERVTDREWRRGKLQRVRGRVSGQVDGCGYGADGEPFWLNPKTERRPRSFLARLFLPDPHGISSGHLAEFRAFGAARWKAEFSDAGLEVIAVKKGSVLSAYVFGLDAVGLLLERLGISTAYIYIAVKKGQTSPYVRYFVP